MSARVQVPKRTTVGKYLELVKQQLVAEFAELRGVSSDNLLYVKEDLIIPHVRPTASMSSCVCVGRTKPIPVAHAGAVNCAQNYSFYDFIVTKARGKSGPLFHFDVHEDVRLVNDARVEKDEVRVLCVTDCRGSERGRPN